MAIDRKLTAPFSGVTNSGSPVDSIVLPLAAIPGLTVTQATVATSDYPSFILALLTQLVKHYEALSDANKPKAIVARMIPARAASTSDFPTGIKTTFTIDIYSDVPAPTGAAAEPS